jgi:hypothetical protein
VPVPNVSNESHPSQNRQFQYNQSEVPKEINLKISVYSIFSFIYLSCKEEGTYYLAENNIWFPERAIT